jgi:hypothetical protein
MNNIYNLILAIAIMGMLTGLALAKVITGTEALSTLLGLLGGAGLGFSVGKPAAPPPK